MAQKYRALGPLDLEVSLGSLRKETSFVVAADNPYDAILGMNLLKERDLVMDVAGRRLLLNRYEGCTDRLILLMANKQVRAV